MPDATKVILGYPGTGKTFLLAVIAFVFHRIGFHVIFSAPTNAATDENCTKLAFVFLFYVQLCSLLTKVLATGCALEIFACITSNFTIFTADDTIFFLLFDLKTTKHQKKS
jgi:hypothetical protein